MDITNELLKLIYTYYPQNCKYMEKCYEESTEYNRYMNVLKDLEYRKKLSKKCYAIIKSVFHEYNITKWTNTEYPSVHFSVLLHKNQSILDDDIELLNILGGTRNDLEIYISLLGKYFYTYVIETRKNELNSSLKFKYFSEEEFLEKSQISDLNSKFLSFGFAKLDKSTACINVPHVETELMYEGEVKIFNALFSDVDRNF